MTDQLDVILRRFDEPDEVRTFEKGRFELVCIHGMTIGRATYEPGWRWSEHVGAAAGQKSCQVEHIGMVVSGRATAAMDDGRVFEMEPGDIFYIAPGHDSWVVGDEPYVSLHFIGADDYASHDRTLTAAPPSPASQKPCVLRPKASARASRIETASHGRPSATEANR